VTQGNSAAYSISIQSQNGFSSAVNLGVSSVPGGAGAATGLLPVSVTPPPNGTATATLTIATNTSMALGSYSMTVFGQSGGVTRTTSVSLSLSAPPAPTPAPCSGSAPTAQTTSALLTTSTSTTLNGKINANGLQTNGYFQWGTTAGYGNNTSNTDMSNTTQLLSIGTTITGLNHNTTYHFRVVATNCAGTSYGADVAFTTLP
jgi:hypothetical protein